MAKKPASTFFEFEYKKDKEERTGEFGLTYIKNKAKDVKSLKIHEDKKLIPYIVCPICCRNQPLNRTGNYGRNARKKIAKKKDTKNAKGPKVDYRSTKYNPKGETSFGKFDFENSPLISIRQVLGGNGIVEVDIITINQIKNMSANDKIKILPIINAIRESCFTTLELTEELI